MKLLVYFGKNNNVKIQPVANLLWDRETRMLADNSFDNLDMQNRISTATGARGWKTRSDRFFSSSSNDQNYPQMLQLQTVNSSLEVRSLTE